MATPKRASRSRQAKAATSTPSRSRRRQATSALTAPRKTSSGLPELVYAQASPHSIGGASMFEAGPYITQETAINFASEDSVISNAASRLQAAGFQILQVGRQTINIAGSPRLYDDAFATRLFPDERPVIKEGAKEDTATFVETADTEMGGYIDTRKTAFADVLEGVAIEQPRYFHQNPFAPPKSYWHLDVPGGVSLGLNADRAHRAGTTGRGVKVVMTDTGWFQHPYFVQRGYRSSPVVLGPAAANPTHDEVGHGTAESANAFAAAPDIDFTMVKISFVNTIGGFNAAVALGPAIISNSWGSDNRFGPLSAADTALAAAIAAAVANGVIVVFSAGNGHFGFPGQHPDVISAGGTYMLADGTFRASDYASGFVSNIYPGRNAPDVTGLVGLLPRAAYIMLPLEPGDQIDVDLAGGTHPNADETAPNDGWAAISGTSAAAPQIAGVCALIKQACPSLSPADVKDILQKTARDVTSGTCNPRPGMGTAATVGHDIATGYGLVDAQKAALIAKLRCFGPIKPIVPIRPIGPILPIQPIQPIVPIRPIGPIQPIAPIQPIQPIQPIEPIRPIQPIVLPPPSVGTAPASTAESGEAGGPQLEPEDVAELERMVIEGEGGLDL